MTNNLSEFENQTSNIGGFPYILGYLAIFLPYSILSLIGVIIGITGNDFNEYTPTKRQFLRNWLPNILNNQIK